jgi:cytoskeleton protein RodZ
VASPSATPTPTPTPKEEKPKPVELIVEAMDSVEIEYSAANGKSQKIRLSADQVHTFKSRSGLKVTISNGGAVNLILNGRDLGIPGDLGKSIKLSY